MRITSFAWEGSQAHTVLEEMVCLLCSAVYNFHTSSVEQFYFFDHCDSTIDQLCNVFLVCGIQNNQLGRLPVAQDSPSECCPPNALTCGFCCTPETVGSYLAFSKRIVTLIIKNVLLESKQVTFRCSSQEIHDLKRAVCLSRVVTLCLWFHISLWLNFSS